MNQELPSISYERNMNHNYFILKKCDFFDKSEDKLSDYRVRMLLENSILGLLPVTHRMLNGESKYYYEINSLQSFSRLYEKKEVTYDELKALLMGCANIFDKLEEYLLDGSWIIMHPDYIFINVETMEPYFVCYPDYTGDVRLAFMEFIDELLTRIDHSDQRAVMLGYQVYRYTRNPNYVISEIRHMMEHTIVEMAHHMNVDLYDADEDSAEKNVDELPKKNLNCGYNTCFNNLGDVYEYSTDTDEEDKKSSKNKKSKTDFVGAIICMFIALSASAIILGAKLCMTFRLSVKQELYLYGAIAMSIVSAVLFLACYFNKKRQEKIIAELEEQEAIEANEFMPYIEGLDNYKADDVSGKSYDNIENYKKTTKNNIAEPAYIYPKCNQVQNYGKNGETVCLGDAMIEERVLRGRIDGKEIDISLHQLPLTIGKFSEFVDYAINDNAISKIHARFEEHEGRVYLCDLNSTNGTVLNGKMIGINKPEILEPGDKLRLGRTCFTYC